MTKVEMAQKIVQVLYRLPELPAPDHQAVKRWSRVRKEDLERLSLKANTLKEVLNLSNA